MTRGPLGVLSYLSWSKHQTNRFGNSNLRGREMTQPPGVSVNPEVDHIVAILVGDQKKRAGGINHNMARVFTASRFVTEHF